MVLMSLIRWFLTVTSTNKTNESFKLELLVLGETPDSEGGVQIYFDT